MMVLLTGANGLEYARAQSGRYSGPALDFERIRQEPPLYTACNHLSAKSGREMLACNLGVEEARRMALHYGGGHGHVHGFLRGFSWGLHSMASITSSDPSAVNQGALAIHGMDAYIHAGLAPVQQQGESQGRIAGFNPAVARFTAAVDTGSFPSSHFVAPQASYAGEDNGYQRWVDANGAKSPQQILRDELASMASYMKAYDGLDAAYLGEVPRLSLWDAWHDDGIYRFEPRPWLDAETAFKFWRRRPPAAKSRFDALNNPPLAEPVLDAEGKQVLDNGKPKMRMVDLQQIFRSAFVRTYQHYVQYYFSRALYRALDDGQIHGELVGIELGKRMAYQKGMMEAFNAEFKARSRDAFQSSFENAARASFAATFQDYAASAKLDVDAIKILGMEDDGILQPGEAIAVSFRVRNSGGRATSVRAALAGDVTAPQAHALGDMPALATRFFTTPALAVLNPELHTGVLANILLKVNEKEIAHAEKILTPIQIASYKNSLETTAGTLHSLIAVQNISTLPGAGEVQVNLILPDRQHARKLGRLDPGQVREAEIALSELDPLQLIQGMMARIQVTMDDRFMSDSSFKLLPPDTKLALAAYFDQLIKGRGLVPAAVPLEDRIAEIKKLIAGKNLEEVSAHKEENPWKDGGSSTMLGRLVHNLKSQDQTPATRKAYARMGQDLWEHRRELGKFLFIKSGKRKEYESLCKELMQR